MLRDGIRDDQWDRIKDLLPGRIGHVGANARNNRRFIDAVLYRYRTGIPWRDLPPVFGTDKNVQRRFSRWAQNGLWAHVRSLLTQDADEEYVMIDSTLVRAHQHSSGAVGGQPDEQAIGRSRGGLTTKIHAQTDALGNPTGFLLTPGQVHDLVGADHLLAEVEAGAVIADKAYDADDRVVQPLEQAGIQVVIPPRSGRKSVRNYDRDLYKARHLIENFFCKLKHFRAIATRYDKLSRNFLAAVQFAAILIWLRRGFHNSRATRPATRKMHAAWSSDWMMKPRRS
jgi:transposase